ncbi:MAG: GNAT family N-acetyltransferase [bacterium]
MIAEIVEGDSIILRPLEEEQAPQICEWRNHPDISRFFYRKHIEPDAYVVWMREVAADPDQGLYGIIEKNSSQLIGSLAFKLDRSAKGGPAATLGIMIGDPARREKGLGEEAMNIISNDLAGRFGIVKIIVEVLPENTAAIEFYKKLGFETELLFLSKNICNK